MYICSRNSFSKSSQNTVIIHIPLYLSVLYTLVSSWIWISIIFCLSIINIHLLQVKARNSAGLGQGLSGGPHSVSDGNNLVIINLM